MDSLKGKVVLVAGAGRGIGRATALALHRAGAELAILDSGVSPAGMAPDAGVIYEVAKEIESEGGEPLAFDADGCNADDLEDALRHTREHFGHLDAALWSIGVSRTMTLPKATPDQVGHLVGRELLGAFEFVRQVSSAFDRKGGRIVVLAGTDGFLGSARRSMAAALDGALIGLVRSAAVELARRQVYVNGVLPTARTRLTEELPLFQSVKEGSMTPEHVTPMLLHLLSESSGDTTGEVVGIAGTRAYAFRTRETPGIFADKDAFDADAIRDRWAELTRGS